MQLIKTMINHVFIPILTLLFLCSGLLAAVTSATIEYSVFISLFTSVQQTFISPEIYIFDINTSRQNNSDFSDGFSHSKNKFIFFKRLLTHATAVLHFVPFIFCNSLKQRGLNFFHKIFLSVVITTESTV